MTIGIAKKLFIFFIFFILIFCGTLSDLFLKVRTISETSGRVVGVNNKVTVLSKNLRDNLIEMDASIKKFRLLKKPVHLEYFENSRKAYVDDLGGIIFLENTFNGTPELAAPWMHIHNAYKKYTLSPLDDKKATSGEFWPDDATVSRWIEDILSARNKNEGQIEKAFILIHSKGRQVLLHAAIGFGLSILAGLFGIIFITRSVLRPLERLKSGLNQVSQDNYTHEIEIKSADEFGELAHTFNEMNARLKADEEIRSDFIATLSHEIRTPLSSIRESVYMITEEVLGPINDKQKKFLTIAGDETTRITSLLNHLLDTSMLGAGKEPPKTTPLDPNQMAEIALQRFSAAADGRGITLKLFPVSPSRLVSGEEKEIMQVLMNLLDNAMKFSPKKSEITLKIEKMPEKEFLIFKLSDQGPGIPPDKQALIFQKYYRAQEVRRHMDGVGLGLSISRRIVLAHGGEILVKNNQEKGCTFSFTLPLHQTGQS